MGPAYMYWLKTLPLGAGKIELQLDICMSPAALAAPGVEERRSELVKMICDIHREDLDVCAAVQRAIRSGVTSTGTAVASRAAAMGVLPLPRARTRNHQPHFDSRIGRMTTQMTTTLNGQTTTVASAARDGRR